MADSIVPFNMFKANPLLMMIHMSRYIGTKVLHGCDYLGEKLANFFGITKPKYEAEIREYYWMMEQEKRRKEKMSQSFSGWAEMGEDQVVVQPERR